MISNSMACDDKTNRASWNFTRKNSKSDGPLCQQSPRTRQFRTSAAPNPASRGRCISFPCRVVSHFSAQQRRWVMIYFNWPPGPFLATQYDKEPGGAGFEASAWRTARAWCACCLGEPRARASVRKLCFFEIMFFEIIMSKHANVTFCLVCPWRSPRGETLAIFFAFSASPRHHLQKIWL